PCGAAASGRRPTAPPRRGRRAACPWHRGLPRGSGRASRAGPCPGCARTARKDVQAKYRVSYAVRRFRQAGQLGGEFGGGAFEQAVQVQAVALVRAQVLGGVLDQRPGGRRELKLRVEITQQVQDLPVLGAQLQAFAQRQGVGNGGIPVIQVGQIAVLVEGDGASLHL